MSQQSVFKLLDKKKVWMTSKEVSKVLNLNSVNASLRKLYGHGDILRRQIKLGNHLVYQYQIK